MVHLSRNAHGSVVTCADLLRRGRLAVCPVRLPEQPDRLREKRVQIYRSFQMLCCTRELAFFE